ncbi:hypothetical protein [Neobacillus massiliamazoniensis]|uniref:Uncharacterized protein n=1 Tax=Neobacillus massiliamazoniensis TaxID=1499688 RepID=A0A0U1NSM3_9BACI|nr:hypothetical protein [Neobacillus massiliamazoniensis]CRK81043.1 hypothetical protein BN000_00938 [Neobacillus massiliamazoniensis]
MINTENVKKKSPSSSTTNNKNDIKINNSFILNLTFNMGDSLSLLGVIAGIVVLRKVVKQRINKKRSKEN